MAFNADPVLMPNLIKLLQLSANPERSAQDQVQKATEQFQKHPQYMSHLCAILCNPSCDRYHRQLSGLNLKNFVRRHYGMTDENVRGQVKQMVVRALGDEHTPVRRTAAIVILSVVEKEEGFAKWPGLLEGLVDALGSSAAAFQDGALYCVGLLCEDMTRELEDHPKRPLNALVPVLVRLLSSPHQLRALRALNSFVVDWPNAMKVNSEAFLNGVFACANSKDLEVCRQVCRTFNTLCDVKPDLIGPFINSVAAFMLAQTGRKEDSDLQCEACEFWQVLGEQVLWHDTLRARVPALLPVLLDGMLYDSEEVSALLELDDAAVPLAEKHIAPWFAKGKGRRGKSGEDEEDSKAAVDPSMAWSLRKAAAAALDAVCAAFGDEILRVLMPLLNERLASSKWSVREGAILALGASAEGTINGLVPVMAGLVGSLLQILEQQKQHVLVVSIACWTLGRLSSWVVRQPQDDFLQRTIRALAGLLTSASRRVQEASCSSLAVVANETWAVCKRVSERNDLFSPFVVPAVSALMNALPRYQAKNLLIGYDLLGAMLRGAPAELAEKLGGAVWPVLLRALAASPSDRRLVALLDCVATAALSLGPTVAPHAVPLLRHSFQIALAQLRAASERTRQEQGLLAELRANRPDCTASEAADVVQSRLGAPSFDLDFAIVALDLCGSVCEALGAQSKSALSQVPLADLLQEGVLCGDSSVKQAAFGLVGDLARHCWELLPGPQLLGPVVDSLYGSNVNLCMNASWALGELAARVPIPPEAAQEAVTRLRRVLCRDHDGALLRNVAITLCRLAPVCSALLASTLHETGPYWITPLMSINKGPDRVSSHQVLLRLFAMNVPAALAQLPRLASLLHSWTALKSDLPPPVRQSAKELFALMMANSAEWQRRWTAVTPEMQQFVERQLK